MGKVLNLKEQVMKRSKDEQTEDGGGGDGLDSKFIMECLNQNELGDGELFKKLFPNDFVFNISMDCWMCWSDHHWEIDKKSRALASVEKVARVYQDEAKRTSSKMRELEAKDEPVGELMVKRKLLNQRVSALRTKRRRLNCLYFACTSENPLAIEGEEVDQKPWLLPCANGVINLRTGELEPGRQKDYLLKASPVAWPEDGIDSEAPAWEKFLMEILVGDEEMVRFLQRLIGLGLIGMVVVGIFIVMSGRGRNGKGTIIERITEIMGPLAGAVRSEMLLDQGRITNSSGPTPDIMALRGRRFVFASETDQNCKISPSRVKWLTGDDTMAGRNPNDKYEVNFKPTHTLFLQTNNDPHAPADDFAFWERMVKIPFTLSFVNREPEKEFERRADLELKEKLKAEHPQILAWMVKGCLEFQKIGLKRPAAVKQAVEAYKQEEDIVGDFIRECCVTGTDYHVNATKVYEAFVEWWHKNVSNKEPKMRRFGVLFGKRFEKSKSGTVTYHGVGLLSDSDGSDGVNELFKD
ncbi:DNA primase family protein [Desulfobacula toluolica]|uniref:Phage-plasmid primase, P4 family n=1 Tax=Desulfobacula toluolica (strain DSM 7467 / Tol2) TaxID=651182 RepID=K0NK36_DESTT|nr:phage/plasmid primase, P4 family [Desulfobacula toluolica]CCK81225.1 phage-plasmid primase, P4 family [Desulfobacula toluolica Tol2]